MRGDVRLGVIGVRVLALSGCAGGGRDGGVVAEAEGLHGGRGLLLESRGMFSYLLLLLKMKLR